MCYPIEVQRATANVEVTRFNKKWSPLQIVKSINKSLIRQDIKISYHIKNIILWESYMVLGFSYSQDPTSWCNVTKYFFSMLKEDIS